MKLPTRKIKSTVLFILVVSTVLAGGIGVYHFLNISRIIKERIYSELILAAGSKAEVVETYIAGFEYEAQILSDILTIELSEKNPDMPEIASLLSSAASRASEMAHIDLISPDGFTIASSDSSKIGDDKTKKATYTEGKKGLFFNNLHLSSGGKKPAFGIALPLLDKKNQLLGVVLVDVNADKLYDILGRTPFFGDFGEIFLVNKDNLLISPSKYLSDTFLKKEIVTEVARTCSADKRNTSPADLLDRVLRYKGLSGKQVLGTSTYIPERSWCLVAEIDEGEFLTSPIRRLMLLSGTSILLLFSLFLFIAFSMFRIIIKPIQLLHQSIENVSKGQFNQKITVDSSNEIGDLARIFNLMIDRLSSYYDDLEKEVEKKTADIVAEAETRKAAEKKLEATVDELQRMNKFMTDRELRMVELKKEIEVLKNKG